MSIVWTKNFGLARAYVFGSLRGDAGGVYNIDMRYAVIDIGSNSVRLMIGDGVRTLSKTLDTTRLSEGLGLTGRLSAEAMERTARAALRFADEARRDGCELFAFATEAVRSAANGGEFVAMCAAGGVDVDVVKGCDEAKLGFFGAYSGGRQAVLDIGGASTELAVGSEAGLEYGKSLHIGSVRIRDLCGEDIGAVKRLVKETVGQYGKTPKFDKLISIGGTGSTLVSIDKKMKVYDAARVHGATLTRERIGRIAAEIHAVPMEDRDKIDGLPPKRKDVIVGAALLMCEVMDYLGKSEITISESDNQEGYLKFKLGQIS